MQIIFLGYFAQLYSGCERAQGPTFYEYVNCTWFYGFCAYIRMEWISYKGPKAKNWKNWIEVRTAWSLLK